MKKFILLLLIATLISCQDEDRKEVASQPEEEEVIDSIPTLTGQFIYVADAAVLRGEDFVYGVSIDSMSQLLADRVKPLKKEDFDMVQVTIKGKISPNLQQEGWDEIVEIKEIIEISGDTVSAEEELIEK